MQLLWLLMRFVIFLSIIRPLFADVTIAEHPSYPLTYCRVNGGGGQELRECLKELAGKDFVFKIHVTPYNFTPITTPSPFLQSARGIILYMLKTFSSNSWFK